MKAGDFMQSGRYPECCSYGLDKTVKNVVELLKQHDMTISVCESCTGGLLSELITSVSGASEVYELGICTYSEKIKNRFLGVPMEEIAEYGVVSREVALAMVCGLKKVSGADVCISTTGVAGPSGGTEQTPVGTVYIGVDVCGKETVHLPPISQMSELTRDKVRYTAAEYAFGIVEEILTEAFVDERQK